MKVTRIDVYKLNVAMIHDVVVPIGILAAANNVVVRITTDGGIQGWGEASPFAPITGETQQSCYDHARLLSTLVLGKDPRAVEARMAEINAASAGDPSLRSAFDMALHDILGQAAQLPLYALLGGERRPLTTDFTIGMQESVSGTLERLSEGMAKGFMKVKLKVGRPGLADVAHVTAVREHAGVEVSIRIDSNQGWDYPTALRNLLAMEPLGVAYSEQPVAAGEHHSLRRLRDRVSIPICADESVFDDTDALELVSTGAADYLNIKLGKSGGISTALRIESIARGAGCKCMVGCFAETRLGLTAAAHLASARPNIHFVDLDSALNQRTDPVEGGALYDERGGGITLPDAPGLGARVDEAFLGQCEQYTVKE